MKIGTAVFTYNRSRHTKQVLDALKENYVIPEKLYLFQDGMRSKDDDIEWHKVNSLIKEVDWCKKEIIISKENKGLAKSIVSGVNYMFESCDAVIILEDDCIPTRNFINFMNQCLNFYSNNIAVYGVSGYSWPIDVQKKDKNDIYFSGRISTWGWGTWKNRWKKYDRDISILKRIRKNKEKSRYLETWGSDLERILQSTLDHKSDSWAIYWALRCIEDEGMIVTPYTSLIYNNGFDGTGENCGISDKYCVNLENDSQRIYSLPSETIFLDETMRAFAPLFGSYTALENNFENRINKENIIVYGIGNFFRRYEKILNEHYSISAFIDKNKEGFYAGREILKKGIENRSEKIVIMLDNMEECKKVKKYLIEEHKIPIKKIIIGKEFLNVCLT